MRLQPVLNLTLCVICVLLHGCSHVATLRNIEHSLSSQNADQAIRDLERLRITWGNDLLYHMHAGVIHRHAGRLKASISSLQVAKKLLEKQEVTSISETIGSYTITEYSRAYEAFNSEIMMLYALLIMNYLEINDYQGARVEVQQVSTYLKRYPERKYYGSDAFVLYLSGLVYELNGESDNALIAYRQAFNAYSTDQLVVPDDLKRQLLSLTHQLGLKSEYQHFKTQFSDIADTVIQNREPFKLLIVHTGFIPALEESAITAPDPSSGIWHRIALPTFTPTHGVLSSANTAMQNHLAIDVFASIKQSLEAKVPTLTARALTRAISQHKSVKRARKENELLGQLLNIATVIAQSADTRHWRILPQTIHIIRWQADQSLPAQLWSNQHYVTKIEHELKTTKQQVFSYYIHHG